MIETSIHIAHTSATLAMTGLIWFVQVVHYPLFRRVGNESFIEYERLPVRRTGWVVGPVMLTEAATAVLLVALADSQPMQLLAVIGAVLLGVIWVSTWGLQVPAHRLLEHGFDASAARRLVTSNWIRTLAWTARGAVALAMLVLAKADS